MFISCRILSRQWSLLFVAMLSLTPCAYGWQPGPGNEHLTGGFEVDRYDREDVLGFYHSIFQASEGYENRIGWDGDVSRGRAGTTSNLFKHDVLRRINFYRAMAGVPAAVTLNQSYNEDCQQAALIFAANNTITHNITNEMKYYTSGAAEAALKGNLAMGKFGPGAIDAYMLDDDPTNVAVGHRRWLLYPPAVEMGIGDLPPRTTDVRRAYNVTRVHADFGPRPAFAFVSWPSAGYFPHPLATFRWSLTYPGADFTNASVSVKRGDTVYPTTIVSLQPGYGDRSLVWDVQGLPSALDEDLSFTVTVSGIANAPVSSYQYQTTFFDPASAAAEPLIAGPELVDPSGGVFSVTPLPIACGYEWDLFEKLPPTTWTEGAELSSSGQIDAAETNTLLQLLTKRSGAHSFQMHFHEGIEQRVTFSDEFVPTPATQVTFYQLSLYTLVSQVLYFEVSKNDGMSWTPLWSRVGRDTSLGIETLWTKVTVDLADYAGQSVRLRFRGVSPQGSLTGALSSIGYLIDDITITPVSKVARLKTLVRGVDPEAVVLNQALLERPLEVGDVFSMRARAQVGSSWFGWGPTKVVQVVETHSAFDRWQDEVGPLDGGLLGDDDQDGIANLVEYAFGSDPRSPGGHEQIPVPQRIGDELVLSFTSPAGVSGVQYGAEWSTDLRIWHPLVNQASFPQILFKVSTVGRPNLYLRHKIDLLD